MKKLYLLLTLIALGVYFLNSSPQKVIPNSLDTQKIKPSISPNSAFTSTTLFVPYWTLNGEIFPSHYDMVAYFGITANTDGIDTKEEGYKDITPFIHALSVHQKSLLTIRLLDQTTDEKILDNSIFQEKIIQQSLRIAKNSGFSGIILDFEYKALAFDEVLNKTTSLSSNFAKESHKNHLTYYQTLYGDTFYLYRPFNVEAIGKVSDGIFILAYDFHKANGNPGPNFPFYPLPDENYSFMQMVNDFRSKVPANKLSIVFGIFGYDWIVDDKGQSLGEAESLTTQEILQKFIYKCSFNSCIVSHNKALETEVTYKDTSNKKHIVWFEDMNSVEKKEEYLKSKGINSTAFWAYFYF